MTIHNPQSTIHHPQWQEVEGGGGEEEVTLTMLEQIAVLKAAITTGFKLETNCNFNQ